MAPPKFTPDKPTFERWLEEGLTHQQMADRVYQQTGRKITRAAVTLALMSYGLAGQKPRYKETVPWRVRVDHAKAYPVRMLRLLGRQRAGLELNDKEQALLDAWLEHITNENLIVAYDPDDDTGFHYVDAKFRDHDDEDLPLRKKTIHLAQA